MIGLEVIRGTLRRIEPARLMPEPENGRAAVALVFAGMADDLRLCFIQRAARKGDHWSGQMAFPGGRAEEYDATIRAVAERETAEEVGLALEDAEYLGRLSELWIRRAGIVTREVLSPFAYYYPGASLPDLTTSDEVAEAYWIPVRHLWHPRNAMLFRFQSNGAARSHPGIRYRGQVIWGLTHMMLTSLGDASGVALPAPPAG